MTHDERVLLDVTDGLATVTLNRPEKLNAIDYETYVILSGLADELTGKFAAVLNECDFDMVYFDASDGIHEQAGQRGNARHPAQEVQRGALGS